MASDELACLVGVMGLMGLVVPFGVGTKVLSNKVASLGWGMGALRDNATTTGDGMAKCGLEWGGKA